MGAPVLVLGRRDAATLYAADTGYTDGATAYDLRALTARVAPEGVGGECVFTNAYLAVVHTAATDLLVTPIVDGVRKETQALVLPTPASGEQAAVYELGLSEPLVVAGVEQGRFALRGTWVQLEIATRAGDGGPALDRVAIEGVEVEYEPVRESRPAQPL